MTHVLNLKLIVKIFGSLLIVESLFMMLSAFVSLIYHENDWYYFIEIGLASILLGSFGVLAGRKANKYLGKREGSIIVTSVWIVFSFIGMMPFWISGEIPSFTDAFLKQSQALQQPEHLS